MRKIYAALALVATIIGSALAFGDGLTVPFSMPVTTCSNQFVRSIAAITGAGTCASIVAGDMPALTGVVSSSAGSLTTAFNASAPVASTYTPTFSCGSGSLGATPTINAALYTQIGKWVLISVDFTDSNNGTCAGSFRFSLPVSGTTLAGILAGQISDNSLALSCAADGGTAFCVTSAGLYPLVTGNRFSASGLYAIP